MDETQEAREARSDAIHRAVDTTPAQISTEMFALTVAAKAFDAGRAAGLAESAERIKVRHAIARTFLRQIDCSDTIADEKDCPRCRALAALADAPDAPMTEEQIEATRIAIDSEVEVFRSTRRLTADDFNTVITADAPDAKTEQEGNDEQQRDG